MDSVAGVGYSYSLNSSDYNTSDSRAQTDTEATLQEWFRMYPFFANHSVFLQGDTHAKLCKAAMTHDTPDRNYQHAEHDHCRAVKFRAGLLCTARFPCMKCRTLCICMLFLLRTGL